MKKITTLIIAIAALLVSCDKIEGPYVVSSGREAVTVDFPEIDGGVYRKVLLEEYTGHRCVNCPSAHQKLEELHGIFQDTLITVGIHATALANTTMSFPYDFRTEAGNQLANDFGISSVPAGIVNRVPHTGGWGKDEWYNKIMEVDRSKVFAAIQVINQYDFPATGNLKVNAKVSMLEAYEHPLSLSLFLIEDGIIKPQMDGEEMVTEYTHNHVMRAAINGTYGGMLTENGVLEKGNGYTYGYSVSFAGKDWVPEHCSIVAILFDKVTGEVLQVEKAPVIL